MKKEDKHNKDRCLIDAMDDAVLIHDLNGNFLAVNDTAAERLGYSREQLLTMSPQEIDAPKYAEKVRKRIRDIEANETLVFETVHETKQGNEIPVEVSSSLTTYHGEPAILSVARDISQRKKLEQRLHLIDFSLNRTSLEIYWITPEGKFVYTNETTRDKLGYTEEELENMYVWDVDPNHGKEIRERRWELLRQEKTLTFESDHITKQGKVYPVEITNHYIEFKGKEYEFAFAKDITKRKQAQKRFKTYMENSPYGVFVIDNKGNFLEVNDVTCEITGLSENELLTMNLRDLHDLKTHEKILEKYEILKEKGEVNFEIPYQRKNGKERYLDILAVKLPEENYLCSVEDITERKQTEKKLREAVDILDRSPTVAFTWKNKEGWPVEYVSENVKNIFGYSTDAFTSGKLSYEECIHPDDLARVKNEVEQFSNKKGREEFVHDPYRIKTKNGEIKIVKDWTSIVRNSKGNITHYRGIVQDITERKRAIEKLEVLHKYSYKLNKADSREEIFNHTLDALQNTLEIQYVDIEIKKDQHLKVVMERGFESPQKLRTLPLDGPGITVRAANTKQAIVLDDVTKYDTYLAPSPGMRSEIAVPIMDDQKVLGVLNVESKKQNVFNERDQQLIEQVASHVAVAIKKLREKKKRVSLQELDKLRNRFLSMAAHEINTPLTPIKSNLEMLLHGYSGELSAEQEAKITRTLDSVDRLKRLVNDFRRIANLHTDRLQIDKAEINFVETVEKTLEKYKDYFSDAHIHVIKQFPSDSIKAVYDEDRMIQVIQNLVENAIDYTEDTIWIQVKDRDTELLFSIRDNGPGIPKDKQETIFDPFYRVEVDRVRDDRTFGGTGLGLHICRQIMKAHQGKIQVDSTLREGSTFTVILPKQEAQKKE